MGWIWDSIKKAVRNLFEWLIRPIVNWIRDLIEDIVVWIRVLKHELTKWIASWLDSDLGLLLAVVATVATIVWLPQIVGVVNAAINFLSINKIIDWIKKQAGKFANWIHLIDLDCMHKILLAIWGDYRKACASLARAVSSLAEELGEGSGYIHAYFAGLRGITYNTYAILGLPPEAAELQVYNETANFFKKIDDRFARYARDPQLVAADFITDVMIPQATQMQQINQQRNEEIVDHYNRINQIESGVVGLRDTVTTFVSEMPDEIKTVLERRLAPVLDVMNDWIDTIELEVMPAIDGVKAALDQRTRYQEMINTQVAAALDDPYAMLLKRGAMDSQEQGLFDKEQLKSMISGLYLEETEELKPILASWDLSREAIERSLALLPVSPSLSFEPPGVAPMPVSAASNYLDWFVGEY